MAAHGMGFVTIEANLGASAGGVVAVLACTTLWVLAGDMGGEMSTYATFWSP